MKFLLAIIIIATIAFVGSRISFRKLPMGFRNILLTGTEYIFLGILLGKIGLNILDAATLDKLKPALLFALTWIGFLFGLQFEIKQLKELPRFYFSITAIQAIVTFIAVALPVVAFMKAYSLAGDFTIYLVAATLASAACCTAQAALAIVAQSHKFKNRNLMELLRYISAVDGLFGLAMFSLALCIFPAIGQKNFLWLNAGKWLLTSLIAGIFPALILISICRYKFSQREFLLFIIGIIMFCAGLADASGQSPLVAGLICGVIVANFSAYRLRALTTVVHAEKSIYLVMLLLIGASWCLKLDIALLLTVVYFLLRVVGKMAGGWLATRLFPPRYDVPPHVGIGLVSEGGLAIAIIMSFKLLSPSLLADSLITIMVFSVLLSELCGPSLIFFLFHEKKHSQEFSEETNQPPINE